MSQKIELNLDPLDDLWDGIDWEIGIKGRPAFTYEFQLRDTEGEPINRKEFIPAFVTEKLQSLVDSIIHQITFKVGKVYLHFFAEAGLSKEALTNSSAFLAVEDAQLDEETLPDQTLVFNPEPRGERKIHSTQAGWVFEFCQK